MVTAQFVSELGDGITTVALPLYVHARTRSPLATSLTDEVRTERMTPSNPYPTLH